MSEIFLKTLYGECRGEPKEGQDAVGWVIKNRARANKDYWGGNTIEGVCLKEGQFECWKDGNFNMNPDEFPYWAEKLRLKEHNRKAVKEWANALYHSTGPDPTGGSDHYNNPTIENPPPPWTYNCNKTREIGKHQFYKSK